MNIERKEKNNTAGGPWGRALKEQMDLIREKCTECIRCTGQCAFLKEYGNPKKIAEEYGFSGMAPLTLPFMCNLCDLCAAVCPVKLSPGKMFLEMRRESVARGVAPLPEHKGIMSYERKGISPGSSWYSLPENATTVFFPGCAFSGTRMDTTIALFEHLKGKIPGMGIVLDCCTKPSHDLGRNDHFTATSGEMKTWLTDHGVSEVVVVCPNCYKVFKAYGSPLKVTTVYEYLADNGLPEIDIKNTSFSKNAKIATLHDPCVLRNESTVRQAVRKLAAGSGFTIEEMPHSNNKTVCCGEGGTVGAVAPDYSDVWSDIRKTEAEGRRLLTYCAGCAGILNRKTPTDHILDAIFFPEAVASGKRKATPPPFTYWNRIRLKHYVKKNHPAFITRERAFHPETGASGSKNGKYIKLPIFILIAGAIAGIHFSGLLQRFDAETLRQAVAASGAPMPVIYMLIYAVAPALFLPGLPITLAGGILFGPLWGVVYSITCATAGASVSFLIARYAARDWIKGRLTSPRWRELDQSVEKNGWKIVAFTRLVPLFPFNLLNYAFGLTSIKFLPYVAASFLCMLPACVAFIVFSSSLLDLVKGKISPSLIIGIFLILVVSMVPAGMKKFRKKQVNEPA